MQKSKLIVGLGKTGLSCAHYFAKKQQKFILFDTRTTLPNLSEVKAEFPQEKIFLASYPADLLQQIDEVVVSPGLSLDIPLLKQARELNLPIVGDIELFARVAKAPIVGITGTNAKGTVTTLVGEMIQAGGFAVKVGGNIGIPVLDLLEEEIPDFYVLEVSSFQLETTFSLKAKVATILNISIDHLDRHGTLENYIAAKQRIYHQAEVCVWNRDDAATKPCQNLLSKTTLVDSFGFSSTMKDQFGLLQKNAQIFLAKGEECLMSIDELLIKGQHNWANALAALTIGFALKIPLVTMIAVLKKFPGLEHRCEWVTEKQGVAWYNDSKGTNVGATLAAIEGLGAAIQGKIVLIAGGLGKGADFLPLQDPIKRYARTVILLGKDADQLAKIMPNNIELIRVNSLDEAVQAAENSAIKNDIVLLSPACASWDMFRDYEQRGEIFKSLVRG